ncbi:hypothetical protein PPYR_14827 [Photinus pyralis]|uniref:Gamma-glutamyltransferase n=1 Tax=Photinus pyralis TaxID=7054 RepID=A0A1Y1MGD2_PHOPY|nr:scoloptoxin SSD14-like [Photinus pyralis]KAB0792868.1 hypothetical protein PPYR_14827 [Photinus pyralis]
MRINDVVLISLLAIFWANVAFTFSVYRRVKYDNSYGGVASNGFECAEIGSNILKKGGSAVDSAIATMACEGVAMPASTGIGGGFLMTIYIRENQSSVTLNAREVAPLHASENMYNSNPELSYKGGLAVAVPGELRGYWYAHKRFGVLPWKEILEPVIDLCKQGNRVTPYMERTYKNNEWQIRKDPGLRAVFINPETNSTYKEGDYIKRLKLAETLEIIARDGANALYDGVLTQPLLEDIREANGIITEEDLRTYRPIWMEPLVSKLSGEQTLYTTPIPGSGPILTFILNVLNGYLDETDINKVENWQKIVETFKYAYAKRSEMGDTDFVDVRELMRNLTSQEYAKAIREKITVDRTFYTPDHYGASFTASKEDHGTANMVILAPNGDAVSVTGTINQVFGAGILSKSTGIILNDEMDDFASPGITNQFGVPPSPANFIRPKKHPLSSMCPSIIVNRDGDVVLAIGAAGGTKITTAVALTIMRHLWFGEALSPAIAASRLHHQLMPMHIDHESTFDEGLLHSLRDIGHKTNEVPSASGFASVTAISTNGKVLNGSIDPRRGGSVSLMSTTTKISTFPNQI